MLQPEKRSLKNQSLPDPTEPKILLLNKISDGDLNSPSTENYGGVLRRHRWFDLDRWLGFFLIVALPTLCAALYFGVYASNQYVSNAAFVVKYADRQANNNLSTLFGQRGSTLQAVSSTGVGFGNSDSHVVSAYISSQAAMEEINNSVDLRSTFQRSDIDLLAKFDSLGIDGSNHALFKYYLNMINVEFDPVTGITTISARAFEPKDASDILEAIMQAAEKLINGIDHRMKSSAITISDDRLENAKKELNSIEDDLISFRERETMLSPVDMSAAISLSIAELISASAYMRSELNFIQKVTPNSEKIELLKSQISSVNDQIRLERENLVGPDTQLAPALVEFEKLMARREIASQIYIAALQRSDEAKHSALEQRVFIERIFDPTIPDYAEKPERIMGVLVVLILGLCLFSIARVFIRDSRMHHGR